MRRVRVALVVGALLLVAACGSGDDADGKPRFGDDGSAPASDLDAVRAAAVDAGIRDCPDTTGAPATGDDALPDVELECLGDGPPVRLSGLRGPAVINLWASWCGPCREELPLLARLDDELRDEGVTVLGVDVQDQAPEAAVRLAADSGVTYPQLHDPDALTRAPLGVAGLPQTVFVDAQGRMVATERVPFRSYAELTDAVRRHLEVTP